MTNENDIALTICSPTLNDNLTVHISRHADVNTLKQLIESAHPQHPSTSQQSIIHSGRTLQNEDILHDILKRPEQGCTATFRLLVKPALQPPQQPSAPQPPQQPFNSNLHLSFSPGGYQIVALNGQYYLAPVLVPSAPHLFQQQSFQQQQQQQQQANAINQPTVGPQQQPNPLNFMPQQQANPIIQPNVVPQQPILVGLWNNIQRTTSIWLAFRLTVALFILCQGASIGLMIVYHIAAFLFFLYQTGRLQPIVNYINQWQPRAQPNTTAPEGPATSLGVAKRVVFTFLASLWPTYGIDPAVAQALDD